MDAAAAICHFIFARQCTSLHVEISPQGSFSDKGLMRRDQTLDVAMSNPSDGNATEQILADPEGKEGHFSEEVTLRPPVTLAPPNASRTAKPRPPMPYFLIQSFSEFLICRDF